MRFTCSVLWILFTATCITGNTEIVNFATEDSINIFLPFTETWPVLSPDAPTLTRNITSSAPGTTLPGSVCRGLSQWTPEYPLSCPSELWLVLDLDAKNWQKFKKFTLRLSWPAFHPTDINMKIFESNDLSIAAQGQLNRKKTRRKYARIQFIHAGVLTPSAKQLNDSLWYQVPVVMTLEPLHLGILPSSIIPVLVAILFAILIGIPLASKVNVYLRSVAQKVCDDERVLSKSH